MIDQQPLSARAATFAKAAHDSINHRRKFTDEPYHVHLARVAALVATVVNDEEIIAAAWLHDVLEDVAPHNNVYNADAIEREFGKRVLKLVIELTDVSKAEDGNRATRKALDRIHIANASPDGMTIKLADLIDNATDIAKHDAHFSRVFRKEAALLLPLLTAGNASLHAQLTRLLR